ncbi:MAG: rRNA maturation RNase YbeY [Stellaceae bacterium]|jgi:probable rRNA maturation factor
MAAKTKPLEVEIDLADPCALWRKALPGIDKLCQDAAIAALAVCGKAVAGAKAELSLVLADDAAVRELNREFRGLDKPTNVLSFPASEKTAPGAPMVLLGDVVLAYETVAREAHAQGKSLAEHAAHLVVHGVLHLLGFDHERGEAEAARTEALETQILARLGIPNPYRIRTNKRG